MLVSTFSALMVGIMVGGVSAVAVLCRRAWRIGVLQALVAAIPVLAAVWVSRVLEYVAGGGQLIDITPNPLATRHPISGPLISVGPVLVVLALGSWLWKRRGWGHERILAPGIALVVCTSFYFFVDVRDHQDVYVGWRAGHLLFITAGGMIGWTWWRLTHATARRWHVAGVVSLVIATLVTLPTVAIDLYNTQDLTNRQLAAGFPWTLVLGHDEVNALHWIATQTPPDARVQVDALARDPGTWAYIPAFAERRMSGGLPISMIPLRPYEEISRRVRRLYEATDAASAFQQAQALQIDVLVVGNEENTRHPNFRAMIDQNPQVFPPLYRTRNITLYATSERMRSWMREHH
jgi:uncharacterized membrane protein